jgi:hypothetical protein
MKAFFKSFEKASPSSVRGDRPILPASISNARLLYQPALPVLLAEGSRSSDTPMVSAPPAKVATMRLARPYPVEHPSTATRFGHSGIDPCRRT